MADAKTIGSTLRARRVPRRCKVIAGPVVPDEPSDALRILEERRNHLSANRTRAANQLHALLRELLAGDAPTSLTANTAAALLRGLRARTLSDRVRVGLCKDLIADVRRLDQRLAANQKDIDRLLDEHGTRLRELDGIGQRRNSA